MADEQQKKPVDYAQFEKEFAENLESGYYNPDTKGYGSTNDPTGQKQAAFKAKLGLGDEKFNEYFRYFLNQRGNQQMKEDKTGMYAGLTPNYMQRPDAELGEAYYINNPDGSYETAGYRKDGMNMPVVNQQPKIKATFNGTDWVEEDLTPKPITTKDLISGNQPPPATWSDPKKYESPEDQALIQSWTSAPGIENVVGGKYYGESGDLYRNQGNAYWQEKDGKWKMGSPDGTITDVEGAPWLKQAGAENPPSGGSQPPASTWDPSKYNSTMNLDQLKQFYSTAPGIENVLGGMYYDVNGQPYRMQGSSIWYDTGSKSWQQGEPDGTIKTIQAPKWGQKLLNGAQIPGSNVGNQNNNPDNNGAGNTTPPGTPLDVNKKYTVEEFSKLTPIEKKQLTDAQRMEYWSKIPGIENVKDMTYYNASGQQYRYDGPGYWQDNNTGKWWKGNQDGTTELFGDAPPWEVSKDKGGTAPPKTSSFQDLLLKYFGGDLTGQGGTNPTGLGVTDPYADQRTMLNNQVQQLQAALAKDPSNAQIQADLANAQQNLGNLPPPPSLGGALGGSGTGLQPGLLTLMALLSQQQQPSWVKPGTPFGSGYGQTTYGGAQVKP